VLAAMSTVKALFCCCCWLVSEPSLKMRSLKLSLRQKVMQKNSRLMRRREVYGKHVPAAGKFI